MQRRPSRAPAALFISLILVLGAACSSAPTALQSQPLSLAARHRTSTAAAQGTQQPRQRAPRARAPRRRHGSYRRSRQRHREPGRRARSLATSTSASSAGRQRPMAQPAVPAPTPNPNQQTVRHALATATRRRIRRDRQRRRSHRCPSCRSAPPRSQRPSRSIMAPVGVGAAPNSDMVIAADGSDASHSVARGQLELQQRVRDRSTSVARQCRSARHHRPTRSARSWWSATLTTRIRPIDPLTQAVGAPVSLGAGPHSVNVSPGNSMMTPQVYVTNAGDGTVTVLDQKVSGVQSTLSVGGRPVGVVRTVDGRLWVADGDSGAVTVFDANTGTKLDSHASRSQSHGYAATPDGHYLVSRLQRSRRGAVRRRPGRQLDRRR